MADSDEDYIGSITEDEDDDDLNELPISQSNNSAYKTRSSRRKKKQRRGGAEWEVSRTWESLVEGADGTINSTVEGLLEAGKRKR